MEFSWCQQSDAGLPKPDLVIFLDIDPVLAQNRGEYGAERYEKLAFQHQVRSNYMKLKDETWKVLVLLFLNDNKRLEKVYYLQC